MHRNVYDEVCYISITSCIYLVLLIMTIHIFLVEFPTLSLECEGYISSRDVSGVKSVIVTYFGVTTRSVVSTFRSLILLERPDTGSDPEKYILFNILTLYPLRHILTLSSNLRLAPSYLLPFGFLD